jgi:hypothetical protein
MARFRTLALLAAALWISVILPGCANRATGEPPTFSRQEKYGP